MACVLALDQGTTSSRSIVFGQDGLPVHSELQEFPQIFPSPGHVEHDPEQIWSSQMATAQKVLASGKVSLQDVAALGITNQRETVMLWEKKTGKVIGNAIVWQSRITAPRCEQLKAEGHAALIREKTGLVIDAYFSGSKIEHLLRQHGLQRRAENGEILAGTVDSFLAYRLTGGKVHVTDVSNASRTMLFNLRTLDWDDDLLKLFGIPKCMLPRICSSSEVVGETEASLFGRPIPIAALIGDQQAATFGQACFEAGSAKNTYGTGCFMLMNIGETPRFSENGLLTTVGWRVNGATTYCLEGSVFVAGAAIQWLRDGLGIIKTSADVTALADSVESTDGVYFVPAFVGLGTPYWDSSARGVIVGITRGTTAAHIAKAAVQAMAFQSLDVLRTMQRDAGVTLHQLKVDGGATVNDSLLQFQADLLDVPVLRPRVQETTALGAACLAGLAVGVWPDQEAIKNLWSLDREFRSVMDAATRQQLAGKWSNAVERARGWAE